MALRRVALVVGASRGIGAALVEVLLSWHVSVVAVSRSAGRLAEINPLQGSFATLDYVQGDATDSETISTSIKLAVEKFGGIDALIYNAGILEPIVKISDLSKATLDEYQRLFQVNVFGAFAFLNAAIPHMRTRRGRFIAVSSGAAVNAYQGWSAYCCSKAALNMLVSCMAKEERAITSIAIRPGIVDTAMQELIREDGKDGMKSEDHQKFLALKESGSLLQPKVPAQAIAHAAFHAPMEWSGSFLSWDDPKFLELGAIAEEFERNVHR